MHCLWTNVRIGQPGTRTPNLLTSNQTDEPLLIPGASDIKHDSKGIGRKVCRHGEVQKEEGFCFLFPLRPGQARRVKEKTPGRCGDTMRVYRSTLVLQTDGRKWTTKGPDSEV